MRSSFADHLSHGIEHADDRSIRAVFRIGEAPQPVEMTEEFVGPVDQMNDHVLVYETGVYVGSVKNACNACQKS